MFGAASRTTPCTVQVNFREACTLRAWKPAHKILFRSTAMAKIAKTADRRKMMDTTKSTDCPKCSKPTRIVKRVKDRERGIPGGIYISCSACDFYEKL